MTDREVGELWEWVAVINPNDGKVDNWEVKKLIRKLVDERARVTYINQLGEDPKYAEWNALRDFGIDPKDWA